MARDVTKEGGQMDTPFLHPVLIVHLIDHRQLREGAEFNHHRQASGSPRYCTKNLAEALTFQNRNQVSSS